MLQKKKKKKETSKEGLQGVSLKQWRQIDLSVERRARQGESNLIEVFRAGN